MITLVEARRRQDEMQAQGQRLMRELHIEPKLVQLGSVRAEGSFEYGLMVKPDIDIEVVVDEVSVDRVADLARELTLSGVERVMVVTRHWPKAQLRGVPNGIYLGLQHHFENVKWNFDIWFHELKDRVDPEFFGPGWHEKLTPEQRDTILVLKHNLSEQGRYPFTSERPQETFGSADIYRAVLRDGVKTLEELEHWRKSNQHY